MSGPRTATRSRQVSTVTSASPRTSSQFRHFSPIPTKFRRNLWWQNNLTGVRPNRERQPSVRPRSQAFPGSSQRKTRDKPASAACSGPVQACSLLCTAVGMSEKCLDAWGFSRQMAETIRGPPCPAGRLLPVWGSICHRLLFLCRPSWRIRGRLRGPPLLQSPTSEGMPGRGLCFQKVLRSVRGSTPTPAMGVITCVLLAPCHSSPAYAGRGDWRR